MRRTIVMRRSIRQRWAGIMITGRKMAGDCSTASIRIAVTPAISISLAAISTGNRYDNTAATGVSSIGSQLCRLKLNGFLQDNFGKIRGRLGHSGHNHGR